MRQVTENDFRAPEFRDAKVEDYEFRADGALVRKDRWESAVHKLRSMLGMSGREFEIDDVLAEAGRQLAIAREYMCEECDGTGKVYSNQCIPEDCPSCRGTGRTV